MNYMNVTIPTYEDIVEVRHWVPPQPSSLTLTLLDRGGREHHIDFLPTFESAVLEPPEEWMRLRRVFIYHHRMKIGSKEERAAVELLRRLLETGRLGVEKGLSVEMAKECLKYFDEQFLEN